MDMPETLEAPLRRRLDELETESMTRQELFDVALEEMRDIIEGQRELLNEFRDNPEFRDGMSSMLMDDMMA